MSQKQNERDTRSLLSERPEHPQGAASDEAGPSEKEKAMAILEYQRLVRQADELLREQEAERRSGTRRDPKDP